DLLHVQLLTLVVANYLSCSAALSAGKLGELDARAKQVVIHFQLRYGGRPIRRTNALKRGSARKESNQGPTFRKRRGSLRSSNARSNHSEALSVSPIPT